jgi:quercetin dioxygenase-like cupin family protein
VRALTTGYIIASTVAVAANLTSSCAPARPSTSTSAPPVSVAGIDTGPQPIPLILALEEGEPRVRRTLGGAPLTMKVDRQTANAPEFVMGYEEVPPGERIPPHRHPGADEIIFVHRGKGTAELGERTAAVTAGATVYIPRWTRVSIRNTGTEPLAIVFIFSQPGFEQFMRETSVPRGQEVVPLSPAELTAIRQRHQAHILFERP